MGVSYWQEGALTVIAWDGKRLAADRQMTWADMKVRVCKVRKLENGEVIGATGDSGKCLGILDWYEHGADSEKWPKFQTAEDYARLVVARPGGKLVYFDWLPLEHPIMDPFMAFGSGRDYAVGALAMGANAAEAVDIASRYCVLCGMGVDWFEVGDVT